MRKIKFKHIALIFIMALLCFVTACGCGGDGSINYTSAESTLKETHLNAIITQVQAELTKNSYTEQDAKINKIRSNFNGTNEKEVIVAALTDVPGILPENIDAIYSELTKKIILSLSSTAINILPNFYNYEELKTHQKELCTNLVSEYEAKLLKATYANSSIDNKNKVADSTNVYQIVSNYYVDVMATKASLSPIRWFSVKQDGFFNFIFNNFLVYPIGWLLQFISGLFGGYYIIGLFIVTMLIRTLMMPVYNSTNNMTLKMQLMQPDLQKLEAKYANRNDQESQQAKQMEQMRIYKKYKMGFGGCFTMLLQFPVFLGVYQAVQRLQLTDGTLLNSPNWVEGLKTTFLGVDLFMDRGSAWSGQFWGIIVILLLVVGTQFLQQILTTRLQKAQYAKSQENIPEYRRQAMQQNQAGGSMKFMMYFMIVMMGIFVFQSAAGLGVYWLFGNLYSLTQMILNHKFADRKIARLKKKLGIEE